MPEIPPAPGPDYVFHAPPAWGAPEGFDPRKGHPVDPAWPDPEPGWEWWSAAEKPRSSPGGVLRQLVGWRLVIGLAVLGFLVFRVLGGGGGPATGVGSCWKQPGGQGKFQAVDCDDADATTKVISEVATPEDCPAEADGYFKESESDPNTKILCTVPM